MSRTSFDVASREFEVEGRPVRLSLTALGQLKGWFILSENVGRIYRSCIFHDFESAARAYLVDPADWKPMPKEKRVKV